MKNEKLLDAIGKIDDKLIHEATPKAKKATHLKHPIILVAAIIATLALCGFAAYQFGFFDWWLQKPSTDPVETVRSAIENQIDKSYTLSVEVEEIKIDSVESERVIEMYKGSDLATSRGWTDEYLENHFIVVYAKYFVKYDHAKIHYNDGYTEQYFYLTQNEDSEWTIIDNSSGSTSDTPNG